MIIWFDMQFVTDLARARNSKLALVPFGVVFIILWTFPCFLTQDVPGSSCAFPAPPPNWPFTREPWVLLTFWCSFFHSLLLPKSALRLRCFPEFPSHFSLSFLCTYSLSALICFCDFCIWVSSPISSPSYQTCSCNCLLDFLQPCVP